MLETLRRIVQEVNAAQDLQQALTLIVERVRQVMQTDVCSVYLTDSASQQNVLMATEGLNPVSVGKVRLAAGEGLIGLVTERAEPINVQNAPDHARYKYLPETGEERYHAFLGVPIVHHRLVLGVLVVQQRQARSFDESEVTLLVTMAAQLAGAIAHAEAVGGIDGLRDHQVGGDKPFRGLAGAPGVIHGCAVVIYPPADLDAVPNRTTDDIEGEIQCFHAAVKAARKEIEQLKSRMDGLPSENQLLFDAYLLMLNSDSLVNRTIQRIREGYWASTALRDVINQQAQTFAAMDDHYLSERAQDIRDIGRRILVHIQSKTRGPRQYPENTVLVGDEVSASALMEVPQDHLAGVVSTQGSSSSHVAILARALGVPAVMGAADLPVNRVDSTTIVVDGYQGLVYINASETVVNEYDRLIGEEAELYAGLEELRELPAESLDGVRLPLYINSGLLSDLRASQNSGAEGVGLYRTEFPFMIRDRFPGEEEQTSIYRQILETFAPRPVTLRTLDVGGDKCLSYFPIREDNPFLGWRGIRISLDHPDLFMTQLRAMLRASQGMGNLHIMLPMVSSVTEVNESLDLIQRARAELIDDGLSEIPAPRIGAMIEVPSAVYQAGLIAKRVDFLSLGTNDLVQYLLAVDRNNANVANLYDHLHPAVIQAVKHVAMQGARHQVPVSVCGEMAADPAAVILLLGMGLDSLSISATALPRVKWVIRNVSFKRAKQLLEEVEGLEDAHAIRAVLHEELNKAGLGGLLRAGK